MKGHELFQNPIKKENFHLMPIDKGVESLKDNFLLHSAAQNNFTNSGC